MSHNRGTGHPHHYCEAHDELLNLTEAAAYLRITRETLYSWVHQRKVPFRKHGSRLVFSQRSLRDWSDARSISPLADPTERFGA